MLYIRNKLKNLPKGNNTFSMAKKPKIQTYYDHNPFVGETNNLPSKTVPDQSMTIREIINRTRKGLPVTGVRVPVYNETEDGVMPDLRNMDISEIHELKMRIRQTEKDIRKKLQKEHEEEEQRKTEEYYKKKFATEQRNVTDLTPTEEIKPD